MPVDVLTTSGSLGAEKPSVEFFHLLAGLVGVGPAEAVYVGDRLDNDVLPAKEAGMKAIFIRRGPWGYLNSTRPEVRLADARIESLDELPGLLAPL